MFDLHDRVALVTGASRGLGRATAEALGTAGARVVLTDILLEDVEAPIERLDGMGRIAREEGLVHTLAARDAIVEAGGQAMALQMDVTSPEQVGAVFDEVESVWGPVQILVNNAAVFDQRRRFEDQALDLWQRDLLVNLTGPFIVSQRAWLPMRESGHGRIINLSSAAGVMGGFGQASYSSSKAGVIGLTKTLALEGARHGITSNVIAPGPIRTEGFTMKTKLGIDPSKNERIVDATAMRRMGDPDDIAHAICYLASDEAGFVTGQLLPVNGGLDLFVF